MFQQDNPFVSFYALKRVIFSVIITASTWLSPRLLWADNAPQASVSVFEETAMKISLEEQVTSLEQEDSTDDSDLPVEEAEEPMSQGLSVPAEEKSSLSEDDMMSADDIELVDDIEVVEEDTFIFEDLIHPAQSTEELLAWIRESGTQHKVIFALSDQPLKDYFVGLSQEGFKNLKDSAFIVDSNAGSIVHAFQIYIKPRISGVIACVSLDEASEKMTIQWTLIYMGSNTDIVNLLNEGGDLMAWLKGKRLWSTKKWSTKQ